MTKQNQKKAWGIGFLFLIALLCVSAVICFFPDNSRKTDKPESANETSVNPDMETTETVPQESFPAETQTNPNVFTPGSEGPLSFEEARLDNGDKTFNRTNHPNALVYCCYPVFSDGAAADVINADIRRIAEAFAYTYTREEIQKRHQAFGMDYAFSHIGFIEPTYNGDGILSVVLDYNGFWGEDSIYENGAVGYVYNLTTGERLTLTQLTGLPEEQLLSLLQDKTKECINAYLQRMTNLEITDQSLIQPDALTLDDFGFYITENGQIQITVNGIHMRKAEPARGYWVGFRFPIPYSIF